MSDVFGEKPATPAEKTYTDRYRIVIVRNPDGKRRHRWRWTVERAGVYEWEGKAVGHTWSLTGARSAAFTETTSSGRRREEIVVAQEVTYRPSPKPDPEPAKLLMDEPPDRV